MTEPDQAAAAAAQLDRLHGPQGLHAAVLALLLPPGSRRARRAWKLECSEIPGSSEIRDCATQLPPASRLPWFETLVSRMRQQPLAERQALLGATRRVMSARGIQRPIDRLHWLGMRQRLGEQSAADTRTAATTELSQLPSDAVLALAAYSAFLARMIPVEPAEFEDTEPTDAGLAWYTSVMADWDKHTPIPPCLPPDTSRFVMALQELQALAWMQRPTLIRGWVTAAKSHSEHERLTDTAADALRLSCSLLDSPMPPELARHYGELETST